MKEFLLASIIIVFLVVFFIRSKKPDNIRIKGDFDHLDSHIFSYSGGWNELSEVRDVNMRIYEDKVRINTLSKIIESSSFKMKKIDIHWDKIKNISISMDTEIKSNATLSKIFLFGIYAFSKKKNNLTFLIINYVDNFDKEQNIILLGKDNFQVFLDKLNTQRNKFTNI